MGDAVDLALEFESPFGPIRARIRIDKEPKSLADLVPAAMMLTEVLVQRAGRREEEAGRKISCRAGCGACCRQMVPLSPPEAFFLMDMIDAYPRAQREKILGRFEPVVKRLQSLDLIDSLLDPVYSDDFALEAAKSYFSLQIPCPFLVAESCGIHQYRPLGCRDYNVTSPAERCANPYENEIERVRMPLPLSAPLARLTAKLTGIKPRLIPLTLGPRWVVEHESIRSRQWDGLELFTGLMQELGMKGTLGG